LMSIWRQSKNIQTHPRRISPNSRMVVVKPQHKIFADSVGFGSMLSKKELFPLNYISCSVFLKNGDAVLQAFHLLAGIANFLAIGQLIRDDNV
jgi:hypothetical protein